MNTFFLNPNLIECVNITYQAVCPEYVWLISQLHGVN